MYCTRIYESCTDVLVCREADAKAYTTRTKNNKVYNGAKNSTFHMFVRQSMLATAASPME